MDLFDVLACPTCKSALRREPERLVCRQCGRGYPVVDGTPVLLPDASVPATSYQDELHVRTTYDPWIHRVVLQSLPAGSIVLDIGAGNMALDLANVVRMDVTLTPYVDVVGDAHALPFRPETFDFIFSLAVIEHLRQPFTAAQEAHAALRPGGYVYGECNFVYPYHGYPYHFFNATQQGLEAAFRDFRKLRSGVAPYQMPSFALRALIESYCKAASNGHDQHFGLMKRSLMYVLEHPLGTYDRYFDEAAALRNAAGTYYFGLKADSRPPEVLPRGIQELWHTDHSLQQRFPEPLDLGTTSNIMLWAVNEAAAHNQAVVAALEHPRAFDKRGAGGAGTDSLRELPLIDPLFSYIAQPESEHAIAGLDGDLLTRIDELTEQINHKNEHIRRLEGLLDSIERGRILSAVRSLQAVSLRLLGRKQPAD